MALGRIRERPAHAPFQQRAQEIEGGQFNYPFSMALAGKNVWVPSSGGNSVTEIDPTTGAISTFQ